MTKFETIYSTFLSKITDDMYMELSPEETTSLLLELLENSLHWFEFPRFNLYDYDRTKGSYNVELTQEEVNIIATYMIVEWLGQ